MTAATNSSGFFSRALFPTRPELIREVGMPDLVEERIPARFARLFGIGTSVAIFMAVGWSAFAKVSEVSVATGSLIPTGFEQTVQHLDGGVVQEILINEGEVVERGAPLMILKDGSTLEDTETLARQKADLVGQLETQQALKEQRVPDFTKVTSDYPIVRLNNQNAYNAQLASLETQRSKYDSQINQARFELEALRAQIAGGEDEVRHAGEEMNRFSGMLKKGVVTQVQYQDKIRLMEQAQSKLATLRSREKAATARQEELERDKASFEATQGSLFAQRILEIEAALTALDGNIRKKDGRRDRLTVSAPISGIVKSLNIRGEGAVIESGQNLAVIVPMDKPLLAETRVSADQIGYLHPGQPAHVKITAFDFTRYGWLEGHLKSISPSAFQSDNGRSYYLVRISLDSNRLEKAPEAVLLPGMELTADIITGEKTAMQYLLTPLQRTFSSAFGER